MPGIVIFRRRWFAGSDDLVVPMIFLVILHFAWLISLALVRGVVTYDPQQECTINLRDLILGHIIILCVCIVLETLIAFISTRGSILIQAPRASIEYLIYGRLVVTLVEIAWLIMGVVWASRNYPTCTPDTAKKALLGMIVTNFFMIFLLFISIWCTFDSAGRKWVKMKRYQDSMKDRRQERRRGNNRRQSGSRRNWRQRKAFRAYEESWDRRLQLLCCCVERKGHNKSSMSEIAALFTEFFRDLDIVPTDIVAGLVLLRKHQQQRMNAIISQGSNDVYQYLSGVAISPQTKFLQLSQPAVLADFQKVIHYMRFALAVYGWPVYVMKNPGTWMFRLLPLLRCCCCRNTQNVQVVEDNCCLCNFSTAREMCGLQNLDLVYCTYHVDIGETPFFVALDHVYKKVVIAIRGTLSLQDVLTDLKAEPETLPLNPPRDDWQGHKGMIQAAVYIKKKLINDGILQMAWDRDEERETAKYDLVLVGHSLGAGTAAILTILLRADYPNIHCYSYSPPGGLLTLPCVEETKSFITSVVVGKDCVPRIGLPQLEVLRTDILNQIKNTSEAKWKIISKGLMCCGRYDNDMLTEEQLERDVTAHPSNSAIGLSAHVPLYPPGNMIHVVRSHLKDKGGICKDSEPIYQAIWVNNGDFDEVLVSPTMINDHMPDNVMDALEKVVLKVAPEKPAHTLTEEERREMLNHPSLSSLATPTASEANGFVSEADTINGRNGGAKGEAEMLITRKDGVAVFELPPQEQEDLVCAPLASPETLSLASGVAAFSPSTSISGRDSFRQSLQRCAEKRMDSPVEAQQEKEFGENVGGFKKHRNSLNAKKGKDSPLAYRANSEENEEKRSNEDVEAGNTESGEEYTVQLRSGNTFSVKADVVNELVKKGNNSNGGSAGQTEDNAALQNISRSDDTANLNNEESHAILEPSSHTNFVSPSLQKVTAGPVEDDQDKSPEMSSTEMRPSVPKDVSPNFSIGDKDGTPPRDITTANSSNVYNRHSPLESNQYEYGHPNVYYTQAGIGYPHNAFHPPLRLHSFPTDGAGVELLDETEFDGSTQPPLESVEEENNPNATDKDKTSTRKPFLHAESESNLLSKKHLLPRMRRSAEQGDIVHLCDTIEVFEQEEDKLKLTKSSCALQDKIEESEQEEPIPSSSSALITKPKKKSSKPSVSFGPTHSDTLLENQTMRETEGEDDDDEGDDGDVDNESAMMENSVDKMMEETLGNSILQETHL